MPASPHLAQLYIYPIKALAGIALDTAIPLGRGLQYDRRWMLTDPDGTFLSQRSDPRMALLKPQIQDGMIVVPPLQPDDEPMQISLAGPESTSLAEVQVWDDSVAALPYPSAVNDWFSRQLDRPCQLVYIPDSSDRQVDQEYAQPGDQVGFADGFPYLVTTNSSLRDLNLRLDNPVTMERFRPNLVIEGDLEPWSEDNWQQFRIGDFTFRSTKPCGRCQVITIDPANAERGAEPLKTLAGFRQKGHKILFGLNACLDLDSAPESGVLDVGDVLEIGI
jgi:uncharacterized protein